VEFKLNVWLGFGAAHAKLVALRILHYGPNQAWRLVGAKFDSAQTLKTLHKEFAVNPTAVNMYAILAGRGIRNALKT